MKTLHLPFCFYPDPVGGTEIYVESLATCLRKLNVEAEIAVPAPDQRSYRYNDLTVHRFATGTPSLADLYGLGDPVAAQSFAKVLESCAPDVVHLHSWTAGVSIRVLRIAKAAGIPVVFTYHTPTVSCVRGTLLRWGIEQCDGDLESSPCAACMLHGKGLSRPLSIALASLPVAIGERIGKQHLSYAQGASAELVAMATIFAANTWGLPVSTTHVLSSGVAGTMVANGSGLHLSTVRNILAGWFFTLPAAALLSGALYWIFRAIS